MLVFTDAAITDAGGRENNEDAFTAVQQGNFGCWVVCDGLGGHHGGEIASQIAVDAISQAFAEAPACSDGAAYTYLQRAEAALIAAQKNDPSLEMMRTTAVIFLTDGTQAAWGHLGDTRLYHFQQGRIVSQTRDHSVPGVFAATGQITFDEIRHHVDRSRLLKSLGESGELKPTLVTGTPLDDADAFLLCTDGFWEFVYEAEMEADFAAASSPDQWLSIMRERVLSRVNGDNDNFTAIAVWVTGTDRRAVVPPIADPAVAARPAPAAHVRTDPDRRPQPSGPSHIPPRSVDRMSPLWFVAAFFLMLVTGLGVYFVLAGNPYWPPRWLQWAKRQSENSAAPSAPTISPTATARSGGTVKGRSPSSATAQPEAGSAPVTSPDGSGLQAPGTFRRLETEDRNQTKPPPTQKDKSVPQGSVPQESPPTTNATGDKSDDGGDYGSFKRGVDSLKNAQWQTAAEEFRKSRDQYPLENYRTTIKGVKLPYLPSLYLAYAEAQLGDCRQAREALRHFDRRPIDSASKEVREYPGFEQVRNYLTYLDKVCR